MKSLAPLVVVALLLSAPLALYCAGYFLLGGHGSAGGMRIRAYSYYWLETIYRPAAAVESMITGEVVVTGTIQ